MPLRDLPEAIEGSGQLQPEDGRAGMARLRGVDGVVPPVLADGKRRGPAAIAKKKRDEYGECADPMEHCPKCRREFWGQEVE